MVTPQSSGSPAPNAAAGPALVVLAAGLGTRYGGVKQIEGVGPSGETLMDYAVYDARRAGFGRVVFVIRKAMKPGFTPLVRARYESRMAVSVVLQRPEDLPPGHAVPRDRVNPWGTGHALLCAASSVDVRGPFAVVNADDFYGAAAYRVAAEFFAATSGTRASREGIPTFATVGYRLRDTLSPTGSVNRAVCRVDRDGWIVALEEVRDIHAGANGTLWGNARDGPRILDQESTVSMNIWAFRDTVFDVLRHALHEFLGGPDALAGELVLSAVMHDAIARSAVRVKALDAPNSWFGLTHAGDRLPVQAAIARLVAEGVYPERLWE